MSEELWTRSLKFLWIKPIRKMIRHFSARKRIPMAGRRFKLAALLLVITLLFGSTVAQAQSTGVNVIVHLTPLASITQVLRTLTGGTIVDSIPRSEEHTSE